MAMYTIECQDGGDLQCLKTLQVTIPIHGLSKEQINDIVEENYCRITKKQMTDNHIKPSEIDKKSLDETGLITYEYEVESICSACGSDSTRDNEGNIIN